MSCCFRSLANCLRFQGGKLTAGWAKRRKRKRRSERREDNKQRNKEEEEHRDGCFCTLGARETSSLACSPCFVNATLTRPKASRNLRKRSQNRIFHVLIYFQSINPYYWVLSSAWVTCFYISWGVRPAEKHVPVVYENLATGDFYVLTPAERLMAGSCKRADKIWNTIWSASRKSCFSYSSWERLEARARFSCGRDVWNQWKRDVGVNKVYSQQCCVLLK